MNANAPVNIAVNITVNITEMEAICSLIWIIHIFSSSLRSRDLKTIGSQFKMFEMLSKSDSEFETLLSLTLISFS